ncbi:hypothetical protein V2J09_009491 [Rumex salicifolius]
MEAGYSTNTLWILTPQWKSNALGGYGSTIVSYMRICTTTSLMFCCTAAFPQLNEEYLLLYSWSESPSPLVPLFVGNEAAKIYFWGVTHGDLDARSIGKRIILPASFTRSTRYMAQNYQYAMALCRTYDNPSLFITFTANPKWPNSE